jgi:putative ABC transport system ATP-binding protein
MLARLQDVYKYYTLENTHVAALKSVFLEVHQGDFTALMGPSGSGKSTLLNILGCMDQASSGKVEIAQQNTSGLNDVSLTSLRLHVLGFIFQSFQLIAALDVYQNVEFPLLLRGGLSLKQRKKAVYDILEHVDMQGFLRHKPYQLSGGQKQRVAVARALVGKPALVVADEPTASLDTVNGHKVLSLMRFFNQTYGTSFVFSTHDPSMLAYAQRVVWMRDGSVERIEPKEHTLLGA